MKKMIIIILSLIMLLSASATALAKDNIEISDSLTLSEYEREKLSVSFEDNSVFRVFIGDLWSDPNSIKEQLAEEIKVYYIKEDKDGKLSYYDNEFNDWQPDYFSYGYDNGIYYVYEELKYGNVIKERLPDVKINNAYFIYGYSSGMAIYYITDRGEYVYYQRQDIGSVFFPYDVFCDFVNAIRKSLEGNDGFGEVNISRIWDLSEYDVNEDPYTPEIRELLKNQITAEERAILENKELYPESMSKKDLKDQIIIKVYKGNCFELLEDSIENTVKKVSSQKEFITYVPLVKKTYFALEIKEENGQAVIEPISDTFGVVSPNYVVDLHGQTDEIIIDGETHKIKEMYFFADNISVLSRYATVLLITDKGNFAKPFKFFDQESEIYTEEYFIKYGKAFWNFLNSPDITDGELKTMNFYSFLERGDIDKYLPETNRITESADTDNTKNKDSASAYLVPVICAGVILVIAVAVIVKQKKSK